MTNPTPAPSPLLASLDAGLRRVDETCLSELQLDRLIDGELDDAARRGAEQHLATCDPCAHRHGDLIVDRAQFESDLWVAGLARRTAAVARKRDHARYAWRGAAGLALAATLLFTLWATFPNPYTGVKGGDGVTGDQLEVYVRHAGSGQVTPVVAGDVLQPDDAIRFRVTAGAAAWTGVVGVDSAGAVTAYKPVVGTLVRVEAGEALLFDGSIILDGATGPERLVAVFCDEELPVSAIVGSGERALVGAGMRPERMLGLDLPCRQVSFLFHKQGEAR